MDEVPGYCFFSYLLYEQQYMVLPKYSIRSYPIDAVVSSINSNKKIRILVVDDEPDILLTLNAILEERGHYIKIFDDPVEASSHLTTSGVTPYDLVITDYRMPGSGMSGLDLAKRVSEHAGRTRRKTKVFLMSGSFNVSSLPEQVSEALKLEIIDKIIQKPISKDRLIAVVEKELLT
jgi:DNA-binding NtrC family response regulator